MSTARAIGSAADLHGLRATVMGLGVHGGGLASAQFLVRHGARVTVTDLKESTALHSSLAQLDSAVRVVLGRHEEGDFTGADVVIKNPGVPADSPLLAAARVAGTSIETDISLFRRLYPATPLLAVTGSKGKSTTAAALHHCLRRWHPDARLGGNITVSPLAFTDQLGPHTPVVLELSSWQLGDLPDPAALRPRVAVLTNILPDHQDRYPSLRAYAADKLRIFAGQRAADCAILGPGTARWIERPLAARCWQVAVGELPPGQPGAVVAGDRVLLRGLTAAADGQPLLEQPRLPGQHNLLNLAAAALAVLAFLEPADPEDRTKPGTPARPLRDREPEQPRRPDSPRLPSVVDQITGSLARFSGLEHRLEPVAEWRGIRIVNDSAATMPHATAAALAALPPPVTLIAGGNDKQLDFRELAAAAAGIPAAGTAADTPAGTAAGTPAGTPASTPASTLSDTASGTPAGTPASTPASTLSDTASGTPAGAASTPVTAVVLLAGTATAKLAAALAKTGVTTYGPFPNLKAAVQAALAATAPGGTLLFSPAATSFGMFAHEFDRGHAFKRIVAELTQR